MKKLRDSAHDELVNTIGGHYVGIDIHKGQPYPSNCHSCTEISKWWTILHTTVLECFGNLTKYITCKL